MRAQHQTIAQNVARHLLAAEEAVDLAVARIAELHAALPLARLDARLAAVVGQEALVNSASALVLLAETRGKIVATHANLKQASDDLGLAEVNYGDLIKPARALHETKPCLRVAQ